jgi:hypothetical protein
MAVLELVADGSNLGLVVVVRVAMRVWEALAQVLTYVVGAIQLRPVVAVAVVVLQA